MLMPNLNCAGHSMLRGMLGCLSRSTHGHFLLVDDCAGDVQLSSSAVATVPAASDAAPATPLLKPARRLVPPEAEQACDADDAKMEQLVAKCLLIANPGRQAFGQQSYPCMPAQL
jgi:hypothetical protein